jgi:hypothetical protein
MMDAIHVSGGIVDFVRRNVSSAPNGAGWHTAPDNSVFAGYVFSNGQFSAPAVKAPTLAQRKEDLKARVRAHGMAIRRGGFEVNFGTDEAPNIQVLQLRDATPENDDEKNWMASLSAYTAAVIAGAGEVQGAKFRPESNDTIMVTYAQAMGILTGLFDWVASLVQTVWWKCDQIDGAHTHAALDALEATIDQDWPD